MWKIEQALERIIGVAPAFLRPPYGNYNDLVRQVSKERGQDRTFRSVFLSIASSTFICLISPPFFDICSCALGL